MKKCICILFSLCLLFPLVAFGTAEPSSESGKDDTAGKLTVAVSFNAIREIVSAVGGDKITVVPVVPETAEPHHYEPRPKDLQVLKTASLLFVNGLEMETWAEELVEKKVLAENTVIDLSRGIDLLPTEEHGEAHSHETSHEGHHHGEYDPHIWLGLTEAGKMAQNAAAALKTIDPENAAYYDANAEKFAAALVSLRDEYREKIASKQQKTIIVGHEAFAYLCRDLGLEQKGIRDVFNEGEPSAKMLKELVRYCKENDIRVIFSEEQASPQVSNALARDAHTSVAVIYTLETAADGLSLYERQKANLEKIYASLQ